MPKTNLTSKVRKSRCQVTVEIACTREVDRVAELAVCRIIGHKWDYVDSYVCVRCGRSAFDA